MKGKVLVDMDVPLSESSCRLQVELRLCVDVQIRKSEGEKCPRCWKYKHLEALTDPYPPVCHRCHDVLSHK